RIRESRPRGTGALVLYRQARVRPAMDPARATTAADRHPARLRCRNWTVRARDAGSLLGARAGRPRGGPAFIETAVPPGAGPQLVRRPGAARRWQRAVRDG